MIAKAESPAVQDPVFSDQTAAAGITYRNVFGGPEKHFILESHGSGAAFYDHDGDGDLDLYIANGATFDTYRDRTGPGNELYRNQGDGTFAEITRQADVGDAGWAGGVAVGDIDNDGDPDLYISNYGANILYRNSRGDPYADITAPAGVAGDAYSAGAAFFDYDNDGDLDLYLANYIDFDIDFIPTGADAGIWRGLEVMYGPRGLVGAADALYRNDGDSRFADLTQEAGVSDHYKRYGFTPLFSDFDLDGDSDLFVANDAGPNLYYRNQGDGTFREEAVEAVLAFSESGDAQACMGAASADYDNDGDFDLYVTNFALDYNTLYQNDGEGIFKDATAQAGLIYPTWSFVGWGTGFADFDNDSYQDLFIANGHVYPQVEELERGASYGQKNQLLLNQGNGRFKEIDAGPGLVVEKSSRGSAFADFDNDGDLDIAIHNLDSTPSLLRNDTQNNNHWLIVHIEGTESNRDGIGALIRIETATGIQVREIRAGSSFLAQDDIRAHFGLGQHQMVNRLEVHWPSGQIDTTDNLQADRIITIREGRGLMP